MQMSTLLKFCFLVFLIKCCVGEVIFKPKETAPDQESKYKIVCYYTNWAQYRTDPAKFFPEDIDPNLCTHVIFAFAHINEHLELSSFEWNDESTGDGRGMYHRTVAMKSINKDLKVLLAVGGWNHASKPFSDMVRNKASRTNFVEKAIIFLRKHKFDGLDLDWEYPANRDTENRPEDQFFFTELCKDLHEAFQSHGLLVTAAVAAGEKYIKSAYELDQIHQHLDFINIMAYDLRGSWDNITGHNAPLYTHKHDVDVKKTVDFAVQLWLDYVPPEKLILGISSYGRSFKLKQGFESCPLTDTPILGAASEGPFSREKGFLTYFEVCKKVIDSRWQYVWNDRQEVPYAYSSLDSMDSGDEMEWVGFDDIRSVEIKVKYAMKNKLGGAMLWALDMDDFKGNFCNQGKYPILKTINHYLNPGAKVELPSYEIGDSIDRKQAFSPRKESDFIVPPSKIIDGLSSEFLTSTNAFSLVKNDRLQVYKFCQCKNGTHQIKTSFQEDAFIFVDCDEMRVFNSLSMLVQKEVSEEQKTEGDSNRDIWIRDDIFEIQQEHVQPKNQNGFFLKKLFDFSSSAGERREMCGRWIMGMFLVQMALFRYFFSN